MVKTQDFVAPDRIAVAGNSFGGVERVLGAERGSYCVAVDASGGAESWALSPELQDLMTHAVRNSRAPIFFFQAANDYDLSPSRELSAAMKNAQKAYEVKIYPAYGASPEEATVLLTEAVRCGPTTFLPSSKNIAIRFLSGGFSCLPTRLWAYPAHPGRGRSGAASFAASVASCKQP